MMCNAINIFIFRYLLAGGGCSIVIGCTPDDVIYSPLPLYHSVAGMISLAGTMTYGMTMVMRKKFSASNYWADCVKYNVTVSSRTKDRDTRFPNHNLFLLHRFLSILARSVVTC